MFITLAFIPKLTGAIALMPHPVMGAGLLYTSCFLVISGVELIVSRLLDSRRTFIVGLSLLAGIGLDLMPLAFADAPIWLAAFLGSPLARSEEHTSEIQSLMRISYAVFCLKKQIRHKRD